MEYIYPERESKDLEFKLKLPKFDNLVKTCVAFANGTGGKIIIGVDDKSRKIIGIDDHTRDKLYDAFPNSVYDATSPSLLVEIYEKRIDNVNIFIIDVPPSSRKPVYVKQEGMPKGVYLRAGSSTRRANSEYIEDLMRENKRISYDEETLNEDISILSNDILREIYHRFDKKKLLAEKIINQSPINANQFYPTIAGTLSFCENPDKYITEALVRCTQFQGTKGRNIIQTHDIRGNIDKQVTESFNLIRAWLLRDYHLMGAKLNAKMIIPEEGLREAIINAVIHRAYWIKGAVKIALYDDRLEIFNPGNFPGLININHIGDGTTVLRNPHLTKIARRFGMVEQLGSGIKLIFESCAKAGLKKPEYFEGADSVKVIFYFLPEVKSEESADTKLLALFDMRPKVKLKDVEEYLNVSRNTATRRLNQLIKKGKIKRFGKGPAVYYLLVNKALGAHDEIT